MKIETFTVRTIKGIRAVLTGATIPETTHTNMMIQTALTSWFPLANPSKNDWRKGSFGLLMSKYKHTGKITKAVTSRTMLIVVMYLGPFCYVFVVYL